MMSKRKSKKRNRRNQKIRIILLNLIILILFVIIGIVVLKNVVPITRSMFETYTYDDPYEVAMSDEEMQALPTIAADDLTIYGETINLTIDSLGSNYNLDLYDTKTDTATTSFTTTDNVDEGIDVHDMPIGSYLVMTEDGKYVTYDGETDFDFYTITRNGVNNQIVVNSLNGLLHITKYQATENTEELDIMVDAGHGGNDAGSSALDGSVYEKDINLELATMVADELTNLGYNVGLTRTGDDNPGQCEENISSYCPEGRVTQTYTNEAKLVVSVHHNTGGAEGFEVYSSTYSSLKLANLVASKLISVSSTSSKIAGYISDGVYTQTYEDTEAPGVAQDYMYMIRETGGTAMHSSSKDNEANNTNPKGAEAVLIEFGYLDSDTDLAHVTDSSVMEQEAQAVASAIDQYLNPDDTSAVDLTASSETEE